MSRVGKKPITVPKNVQVTLQDANVQVKGPKGTLSWSVPADMNVTLESDQLIVTRPTDSRTHKALHGLTRMLLANMIEGVTNGYQKVLEIEGVGYTAELKGKSLRLNLGYSHPVLFTPPEGITFETPKNTQIIVKGIDKQLVGTVAAKIRSIRPVEPYKGKGIRYQGEYVRRKAGKKIGVK